MKQFSALKNTAQTNEKKAREYLIRYLGELKLHFNLEDEDVKNILLSSYIEIGGGGIVNRMFDMIKSFLHDFRGK